MDTPGYDPVSVTGLVAGGANVVCFTTGRGSVFGCKPTPSIKLATNTEMYQRMAEDMDLNAGRKIGSASCRGRVISNGHTVVLQCMTSDNCVYISISYDS